MFIESEAYGALQESGNQVRDGKTTQIELELRAAGRRLEGYAAVFDTEAQIGGFSETIRAGAFRAALASGADVLALVDHDPGRLRHGLPGTRAGHPLGRPPEHHQRNV